MSLLFEWSPDALQSHRSTVVLRSSHFLSLPDACLAYFTLTLITLGTQSTGSTQVVSSSPLPIGGQYCSVVPFPMFVSGLTDTEASKRPSTVLLG